MESGSGNQLDELIRSEDLEMRKLGNENVKM